nr:PREDICTED: uncharacterized protein LOC108953080 [Musa acuminata subsp. malaccensis]
MVSDWTILHVLRPYGDKNRYIPGMEGGVLRPMMMMITGKDTVHGVEMEGGVLRLNRETVTLYLEVGRVKLVEPRATVPSPTTRVIWLSLDLASPLPPCPAYTSLPFIPEERSEAAATSSPLQGSANPESDEPERDEEKQEELHRGAIKESERKEEKERKEVQSGGKIEVPGRDEENGQKELEDVAKIVEPKRNEQNVPRDLEYGDKQHIWEKLDKVERDHIFASLEQCKTRNSQFGEDRTNFNEIYLACKFTWCTLMGDWTNMGSLRCCLLMTSIPRILTSLIQCQAPQSLISLLCRTGNYFDDEHHDIIYTCSDRMHSWVVPLVILPPPPIKVIGPISFQHCFAPAFCL